MENSSKKEKDKKQPSEIILIKLDKCVKNYHMEILCSHLNLNKSYFLLNYNNHYVNKIK